MLPVGSPSTSEWKAGGWCLASAVVGYAVGFGFFVFSANLFIEPMQAEFGWTTSEATFLPISMLVLAVLFPFAGKLSDAIGPRSLVIGGLVGFAACFLLLATLPLSVSLLRIIAVLLGICCAAAGTVPFGRVVVGWFHENAGLALGLVGGGATLGGVLGVPFVSAMIDQLSWRAAYIAMAGMPLLMGVPFVLRFLHMSGPGDEVRDDSFAQLASAGSGVPLSDSRFWLLLVAMTCSGLSIGIYLNHLRPILTEAGFSLPTMAALGSIFSLAIFGGRIGAGFLLDRVAPLLVAACCLGSGALGAAMIAIAVPTFPVYAVALLFIGLAYGAEADFAAFFSLRFFGVVRFSMTFGVLAMMIAIAISARGYLSAKTVDIYGNHHVALACAPGAFVVATMLMLCLLRVQRRGS